MIQAPRCRPVQENRRLTPPTRSMLPVLDYFEYKGISEYLEDLVNYIDAPQLNYFIITSFN